MRREGIESAVIIEWNSCRNSCIFCNPEKVRRNVSREECKKIKAHLLRQVLDLKKRGLDHYLEISGRDPIEYKEIVPFIKYLKEESNFEFVWVCTHGRNLSDARLVKALDRSGLDQLNIPLYGSCAAVHESLTQEKKSFQETLRGIQNVARYAPRIKVRITSLITRQNYRNMTGIFRLACRYAASIRFSLPCIPDARYAKRYAVSLEKVRPYLAALLTLSGKTDKPFMITDTPFCLFGFYQKNIINRTGPPATADSYSIPASFRSPVAHLPRYRLKTKLPICDACAYGDQCDGFYNDYLAFFDSWRPKPLRIPKRSRR
jgi:MoaA/NifB/PqqE/SkfB family radical SAM enzyme